MPSLVFYRVEDNWTFIDSLYYTFVSLSTIGFGDVVNSHHGHEAEEKLGTWLWVYRSFTMMWLVLGLSLKSRHQTFALL